MTTDLTTPQVSPEALLRLGGDRLAYVYKTSSQDRLVFRVHAADGTPLMEAPSRELAEAALLQQGLEALSVH